MKLLCYILLKPTKLLYNFLIIYFLLNHDILCFDIDVNKREINTNVIRLNKLISIKKNTSRRGSEKFIKAGNIKINNKIVINPGTHIDITKDSLKICDKKIIIKNVKDLLNRNTSNSYKWLVLHKPKGLLCSYKDEKNRKLIYHLFPNDLLEKYRLVSVGRLDKNTSGVLLLTNEYEWVNKLTHPKFQRVRTYRICIEGPVKINILKDLANGIYLENGNKKEKKKKTQPAFIEIVREENVKIKNHIKKISVLNIRLKEGRNRQIRKMFEQINQPIVKIKRTAFENITLKNIFFPKQYRELTQSEIRDLKMRTF